ncbi:RbsD/FucU domain-containing protein [Maribellus mangrovi]|uniref:RbsD/FucU domain-containing protein n=1 Tax=Maribellus mangrovi TaxID=3133146 RepID=UPI0030EF4C80
MKKFVFLFTIILFMTSTSFSQSDWREELQKQLPLLGHRNWILVVDAAYPLQSKPAIKTLATGEDQLDVVNEVLAAVEKAPHVYPEIYLDKELDFVPEGEAAGIDAYRENLYRILQGKNTTKVLHEELITDIDGAAKLFNILVLKTNLTIPYTSVFIRLDCGYWNAEQEKKLRDLMEK